MKNLAELFEDIKRLESLCETPENAIGSSRSWISHVGELNSNLVELIEANEDVDFTQVNEYFVKVLNKFFKLVVNKMAVKEFGDEIADGIEKGTI